MENFKAIILQLLSKSDGAWVSRILPFIESDLKWALTIYAARVDIRNRLMLVPDPNPTGRFIYIVYWSYPLLTWHDHIHHVVLVWVHRWNGHISLLGSRDRLYSSVVPTVYDVLVTGVLRPPDSRRLHAGCRNVSNSHLSGWALALVVEHDVSVLKGGVFLW